MLEIERLRAFVAEAGLIRREYDIIVVGPGKLRERPQYSGLAQVADVADALAGVEPARELEDGALAHAITQNINSRVGENRGPQSILPVVVMRKTPQRSLYAAADNRDIRVDEKVLYERAKLILSIYREVCWSTIDRANDVCDTLICTYGDSLDGALIYLENFAPDEARERFEERIRSLFETKWIIELVDMAMLKIREYPDKGALYCEIISKAYLNRFKYKESEMLEVLNMERSTYYDRKKEAILFRRSPADPTGFQNRCRHG